MANNVDLNIRTNADQAAASMTKLNTSIVDQVKKVQQLEKGYKVLDNAFNKGLISAQKYAKGTQQVDKAIKQTIASQNKLVSSTNAATAATTKQGAAVQQVSKKLNQKSMILQQTGLQLGDLAVQVQSGTSFLLAFGQQATQLIGTFSLLARSTRMIALFSGLGVIVPIATAIAGAFFRIGGNAKTAADKVSELKDSLNAIKNIQAARMSGPTEMFSRFGANAEDAKKLLDLQLALEQSRARRKVSASFGGVKDLAGEFRAFSLGALRDAEQKAEGSGPGSAAALNFERVLKVYNEAVESVGKSFGLALPEAEKLFEALAKVSEAKTLDEQTAAGEALTEAIRTTGANFGGLNEEQSKLINGFIEGSITLIELQKALKDAKDNTFEIEQKRLRAQRAAIALEEERGQVEAQAEAAKASFKSEETSLARKKELLQLEIQFGKESTELRDKIQEFELQDFRARQKALGLNQEQVELLVQQREENQGLANEAQKVADEAQRAADQTERLADASERTERALSGLRGFGESLSVQLAKVRAEVEALETGQDPGIAGRIAELRARYQAEIQKALAEGMGGYEGIDLQGLTPELLKLEAFLKRRAELQEKLKPKKPKPPKKYTGFFMEGAAEEFLKTKEIAAFEKQLELERELLFVSEDRARVLRQFGLDFAERNPEIIAGLEEQVKATREIAQIGGVVEKSFEDGFIAIVEGSKSVGGAFKDMARLIIKELFKVLVVQRAVGSFGGGNGILGFLGNAFMSFGTGLNSSAMGGPLHSGGKASGGTMRANMPYLVGERGPELVMPAHQGSIYNADLTGKAMGGSGKITQVFNFNLSANGDESVKKIVAQAAPQIADMAQKGVIAARRRGGTMRSTFG